MTSIRVLRDLRAGFGAARDQGVRPTCLAFAASDAHAAARGRPWTPLSAEWAYYHAVRRDGGDVASGSTLRGMLDTLRVDGQPVEGAWPYIGEEHPDAATWGPPAGSPELFRRDSGHGGPAVADVIAAVESGSPALVVMTISDAFYDPGAGGLVAAGEPVDPARVHAVVAVGHGTLAGGGHAVLVRNSWGEEWGLGGHAWLAERYLAPRLKRCVVLAGEEA